MAKVTVVVLRTVDNPMYVDPPDAKNDIPRFMEAAASNVTVHLHTAPGGELDEEKKTGRSGKLTFEVDPEFYAVGMQGWAWQDNGSVRGIDVPLWVRAGDVIEVRV